MNAKPICIHLIFLYIHPLECHTFPIPLKLQLNDLKSVKKKSLMVNCGSEILPDQIHHKYRANHVQTKQHSIDICTHVKFHRIIQWEVVRNPKSLRRLLTEY